MTELIITNGDSAADVMRRAEFGADILPWRDALHEGPVPETSSLETLSIIRAGFLAEAFDLKKDDVTADMAKRDQKLRKLDRYDAITLWFEHDLYDQLQLLQLLDFFHHEAAASEIHLVQADDYLGLQTPERIQSFSIKRVPVSAEQKTLAVDIFAAFRKSTPVELARLLDHDFASLPCMKAALNRLFEELPDSGTGLSRTQRQILMVINRKARPPKRLFGAVQAMEEAMFMGDMSCWRCLEEMAFNSSPLIEGLPYRFAMSDVEEKRERYLTAPLTLTDTGHAVLDGKADHATINAIDRWLGGTHVTAGAIWRWDRSTATLLPPA